jgi:uncharacterized tellurite resistance protein B-like protein
MFLNKLNEKEKAAFLKLAYYVATSDNDFSIEEKEIINVYCAEMQINDIDFDKSNFNLDLTLLEIESSESQKIVLLEIMALVYADNILHQSEEDVLEKMVNKFNLNSKLTSVYAEWTKAILALTKQGVSLIEL